MFGHAKGIAMNWEAISSIAEVIGAVGVVASLIYLAVQVKDNTRSAMAQTRQAISDSILQVNLTFPQNEDFAKVFIDHRDAIELEPHHKLQLVGYVYSYLRNWENVHYQYRCGMLSDDQWRGFRINVKALFQVEMVREFWNNEQEVFNHDFRSEISDLLEELKQGAVLKEALGLKRDEGRAATSQAKIKEQ